MGKELDIYSLEEIQNMLQVTRRTLYNWIKDGKLRAFKVGKEWRVTGKDLQAFFESGTQSRD